MRTREQIKLGFAMLALALGVAACGDDKEEAPPDSGSSFTERDATTGGGSDAGTPEEDADVEGEDADTPEPDAGESCEASKQEADQKDWAEGCYKCAPETNAQFLNSCATGWRTFDPDSYPNGWKPGDDLPALP